MLGLRLQSDSMRASLCVSLRVGVPVSLCTILCVILRVSLRVRSHYAAANSRGLDDSPYCSSPRADPALSIDDQSIVLFVPTFRRQRAKRCSPYTC